MAAGQIHVTVSRPIHERLTALKLQRQQELGRQVTLAEIIERLIERWDHTQPHPGEKP